MSDLRKGMGTLYLNFCIQRKTTAVTSDPRGIEADGNLGMVILSILINLPM
jgi:hypothetical protein